MVLQQAVLLAGPGPVLWATAATAVLMAVAWGLSVAVADASWVDVAWGPAFVVVALVAALAGSGDAARRWLLLGLTAAWGLRLGLHVARRKLREPGEDRRYAQLRAAHPTSFALWSLRSVFAVQGALVLVVSLPIQVAAGRPATAAALYAPGLVLFSLGLAFEAVGDEQLRRFRADPGSAGQVMDRGLWAWTRHPNYFGDACVWWGLWLMTLPAGGTWWTALGPLVMTVLLVRVSGKSLLERDIAGRRPGYADYVRRTSSFIPMPPRWSARRAAGGDRGAAGSDAHMGAARSGGDTRPRGTSR